MPICMIPLLCKYNNPILIIAGLRYLFKGIAEMIQKCNRGVTLRQKRKAILFERFKKNIRNSIENFSGKNNTDIAVATPARFMVLYERGVGILEA